MATRTTTLRKIDCIMVKVDDVEKAREFYIRVFGMIPQWKDTFTPGAAGLRFPESEAEIVLHSITSIPVRVDVTYLVDDVLAAVASLKSEGCSIIEAPFDVVMGKCAVLIDPFGTPMTIIDATKSPRS
jgi:predicted enzyme related to lactoylglutathione lyase